MAKLDPEQLRAAARVVPEEGLKLEGLLALVPGEQLPLMIVLCTLPAALPGLQLGWVCVPILLYLAYALWSGQLTPKLPRRLANTSITRKSAHAMLNIGAWVIEKCGRYCRETWPAVVRRMWRKPAAVLVATMALVILLPLPGSNVVPAMAIVALMAGLVWRDGRIVVAAAVLSVLSVFVVVGLVWVGWETLKLWL